MIEALQLPNILSRRKRYWVDLYGDGMEVSSVGLDLIKSSEGLALHTYNDAGHQAIGYGHDLLPGESYPNGITEAQADALLEKDVSVAAAAITQMVKVPLSQNQFDALVDWEYEFGETQTSNSTLIRKLNAGLYSDVPAELLRWIIVDGKPSSALEARRKREIALWNA